MIMRRLVAVVTSRATGASAAWPTASWIASSSDGCFVVTVSLKPNPQSYLPGERVYCQAAYKGMRGGILHLHRAFGGGWAAVISRIR